MSKLVENRAKRKLGAGELVLCMAVNQTRSAEVPMIAEACGFDAIFVDLEHSATSIETAAMICVSALRTGVTPIARVSSQSPFHARSTKKSRRTATYRPERWPKQPTCLAGRIRRWARW